MKKNNPQKQQGFLAEFRDFITKGDIVEMAIGLTVGVAFTKVVNSLVQNIIMPPIGLVIGDSAFRSLYVPLDGNSYESLDAAEAAAAPVLKYGQFISDIVELFIIGFAIFLAVKLISRLKYTASEG
ncbi:MAG: Large-conductance mechanosensitive channel [candidate division WS6 bacterium OLB20]|uniref:Large-conductance mechanosensitive channel n=1 Tax=candidate division WS6 bacterium OLB20 TaxID=1617426 RepID=A0A136LXI3_9BACT|nr:MAG: Large-conductance mechanosensitive channel [candidate division WS6 bacterium OLB20]